MNKVLKFLLGKKFMTAVGAVNLSIIVAATINAWRKPETEDEINPIED